MAVGFSPPARRAHGISAFLMEATTARKEEVTAPDGVTMRTTITGLVIIAIAERCPSTTTTADTGSEPFATEPRRAGLLA